MFERCEQLKAELDSRRPLPPHTLKTLHDHWVLEWTYNSNAIEGNTLTLKETKVVLEGITIGGKSMREHFEVINHKEAIDFVEAVITGDEVFSERLIKSIHQLVLKNIDNPNVGIYRHENVLIAGVEHRPPDFLHVPEQMVDLVQAYHDFVGHPIERAARLLMNFDVMKSGFLPAIFQAVDRLAYYEALDKAHTKNDYQDFIQLSIATEIKAFDTILSLLG